MRKLHFIDVHTIEGKEANQLLFDISAKLEILQPIALMSLKTDLFFPSILNAYI